MAYLMWRDASRRTAADKLSDAIAAYVHRNGKQPAECLTNTRDAADLEAAPGVMPCGARHEIAKDVFYIGDNEPGIAS